jgi:ParB family transcriptional regulator, chromosome partitioning protein
MAAVRRLGMGLGALLGDSSNEAPPATTAPKEGLSTIDVKSVRANPFQPRQEFDENEIRQLSESLKRQGLLQPVVVRPAGPGFYELVAGERRWRAARLAGLESIPAIVRVIDDKKMLELALVENIQRRDLNPMEKARAFRQLMQQHGWTQEDLADAVGMSRPAVANFMRLLELPAEIQEAVSRGNLSMGHARALLAVADRAKQMQLLRSILQDDLSVRAVEQLVSKKPGAAGSKAASKSRDPHTQELEQKLMDKLGFKVDLQPDAIVIPYASNAQLTAILRRLGVL